MAAPGGSRYLRWHLEHYYHAAAVDDSDINKNLNNISGCVIWWINMCMPTIIYIYCLYMFCDSGSLSWPLTFSFSRALFSPLWTYYYFLFLMGLFGALGIEALENRNQARYCTFQTPTLLYCIYHFQNYYWLWTYIYDFLKDDVNTEWP